MRSRWCGLPMLCAFSVVFHLLVSPVHALDYPPIPDCSARADPDTIEVEGCVDWGAPEIVTLGLSPSAEVFAQVSVGICSADCCEEGCAFGDECDAYLGGAFDVRIRDQVGNELNKWITSAHDSPSANTLWDRRSPGACGNPEDVWIHLIPTASHKGWYHVLAEIIPRPGWNEAGTSHFDAPRLEGVSEWCGSLNGITAGNACTERAIWSVDLAAGDSLLVSSWFQGGGLGVAFNLQLRDSSDTNVHTFLIGSAGTGGSEYQRLYVHSGATATYYVTLRRSVWDLWQYSIAFDVRATATFAPDPVRSAVPFTLAVRPNPGRADRAVEFSVPEAGRARLRVVDVAGRDVDVLLEGSVAAGTRTLSWTPPTDLAGGIYFLELETSAGTRREKIVHLR